MRTRFLLLLALALALAGQAPAVDITLKNDGFSDGANAGFQGGFAAGEIGAVRLHPPDATPRLLKKVHFLFGGAAGTRDIVLRIYDDAALTTNPGTQLFSSTYQVTASSTAMQEIDLTAEGIVVSGPIRVGIEFTLGGAPAIARDDDGTITGNRNFIWSGAWFQSNLFGLTGDWIIRAVVGDAAAPTFSVGGNATGLNGSLWLQNNGGDDLVIGADGAFVFDTELADGGPYGVTVFSEPAGQDCFVINGSGTIAGADVTNVVVNCADSGGGLTTLANDGFVPGGQAGFQSGFVAGEVAAVRLVPSAPTQVQAVRFLYGGAAGTRDVILHIWNDTGATAPGSSLYSQIYSVTASDAALQEISLTTTPISVSGPFRVGLEFLDAGLPSVARDDDGTITPNLNFIRLSNNSWLQSASAGLTGDWIIRAVVGDLGAATYSVGGNVSGLDGTLVLQNNGGGDLVVGADGPFVFGSELSDGAPYSVTVLTEPVGQDCAVLNGSGVIAGADISNVTVNCNDASGVTTVLANDGFTAGAQAGFQAGFVAGEIAAARLVPSAPTQIQAVRFLYGGAAGTRDIILHVWNDTGATSPGSELFTQIYSITASDAALQEIDLTTTPIPVSGAFRVGIEFLDDGVPSVARDDDGTITANRNYILLSGVGWVESSTVGLTGDWIIRAVVGDTSGGGADTPEILSILDVGNDQGRNVRIRFAASAQDSPSSGQPVLHYEAFRRIDLSLAAPLSSDKRLDGWEFVGSIPSHGESIYNMVVPTLADSTSAGAYWSVFFVRAATASPFIFYDSPADSGYSIDNLAPAAPQNLVLAGNQLTWSPAPEADFAYWSVYGSASPTLGPGATSLGATASNAFSVSAPYAYFLVTTRDLAGNESAVASVENTVVDVETPGPRVLSLRVAPNPFNPATTIFYQLPHAGPTRLAIFDARGRLVDTLLDGVEMPAGEHRLLYRSELASGNYLLRVDNGGKTQTVKLSLVR